MIINLKKEDSKVVIILCSGLFYIFTSLIFLFLGKIHVDEPYYFTIANLVTNSEIPYRDFFYTQTPLYPYIYSIPQFLFGSSLYIGRLTSIFFGLLTFLIVVECCLKKKSFEAAAIASILIGFNPFLIYHFTFIKLYSLLAFLLILSARLLLSDLKPNFKYLLIAIFLSLSFAIRITILPSILIIGLYLLIVKKRVMTFIIFIITSLICNFIIFIPFMIKAKEQFLYGIWGYLRDRDVLPWTGIFKAKMLFLSEFFQNFGLFVILLVMILFMVLRNGNLKNSFNVANISHTSILWILLIILSLPYLLTKISYVTEYLTFLMPLFAILLSFKLADFYTNIEKIQTRKILFVALIVASSISWFSNLPEFISFKNGKLPVKYINETADYLKSKTDDDDQILSFNNAIVLLADRKIVPGYEMNSCSFDPKWTDEKCQKHRILNVGILSEIVKNKKVGAILITENTFLGNFPSFYNITGIEVTRDTIMPLIEENYSLDKIFPQLGNMNEDAFLYIPIIEEI